MPTKAHSTVVNRLRRRYQGEPGALPPVDVAVDGMLIAVESTATLPEAIPQLLALAGRRYIAATNQDALAEALRLTEGTPLGVMDPHGQIMKPALDGEIDGEIDGHALS